MMASVHREGVSWVLRPKFTLLSGVSGQKYRRGHREAVARPQVGNGTVMIGSRRRGGAATGLRHSCATDATGSDGQGGRREWLVHR